ncbi:hypothetical protein, partial [Alistipes putredinis]
MYENGLTPDQAYRKCPAMVCGRKAMLQKWLNSMPTDINLK